MFLLITLPTDPNPLWLNAMTWVSGGNLASLAAGLAGIND